MVWLGLQLEIEEEAASAAAALQAQVKTVEAEQAVVHQLLGLEEQLRDAVDKQDFATAAVLSPRVESLRASIDSDSVTRLGMKEEHARSPEACTVLLDSVREQLDAAVTAQDFTTAAVLKPRLDALQVPPSPSR